MKIGPETVVSFHYTLRAETGEELETSRGREPTSYLHGARNIIPGLETAMTGHECGDAFSAGDLFRVGFGCRGLRIS